MGDLSAFQFDANQWNDEPAAFVQIPDGDYNCVVQSAEVEENAKGTLLTLENTSTERRRCGFT